MCVCMLFHLRVGSFITITQAHTQTMQQTRMHKAVAGRVKVKMLLSRQRQSDYNCVGAQVPPEDVHASPY